MHCQPWTAHQIPSCFCSHLRKGSASYSITAGCQHRACRDCYEKSSVLSSSEVDIFIFKWGDRGSEGYNESKRIKGRPNIWIQTHQSIFYELQCHFTQECEVLGSEECREGWQVVWKFSKGLEKGLPGASAISRLLSWRHWVDKKRSEPGVFEGWSSWANLTEHLLRMSAPPSPHWH